MIHDRHDLAERRLIFITIYEFVGRKGESHPDRTNANF